MNIVQFKKVSAAVLSGAILTFSAFQNSLHAVSIAEKAKEKVAENKTYIYAIEVSIKNFGTQDQKNEYNAILDQYKIGLGFFMEDNYLNAYKELLEAQKKLDKLYEKVSMDYIERTSKILKELVSNIVEIDMMYNKKSDLIRRYQVDIIAPKLEKYNEKETFYTDKEVKNFHFVYDKKVITRNLDMGFTRLGDAKKVRQDAVVTEERKYEEGQVVDPAIFRYRLENYLTTIELCRDAKRNAIRSYQLMNRNDIYPVQSELRNNRFADERNLLPVFDPRIPDSYKIDASDALSLVHQDEINIKLKRLKKEASTDTAPASSPAPEPQNN
jgi:hypothetical protein